MKTLLDSNCPASLKAELATLGHEVEHCGEWKQDPGDQAILKRAADNWQILITSDKDFTELIHLNPRVRYWGILRIHGKLTSTIRSACLSALQEYEAELTQGCAVIVGARSTRVIAPWELRSKLYGVE